MDPFEYTVILTSLIIGLGIAQLITGTADIISHIKKVKFSLPLILMIIKCFLLCVQDWWINYGYALNVDGWSIRMVLFVMAYPVLLFVWARMLFPTGLRSHESDLDAYYYDQWQGLWTVEMLTIVVSIFHNLFIDDYDLTSQIGLFVYEAIFMIFLFFKISNRKAHTVFQILSLILVMVIVFGQDDVLVDYM